MIRTAALEDAARFSEIYRYYVENTAISFEKTAPDEKEMAARIQSVLSKYPWLTLEEDGEILGYAYASAYRSRYAFFPTVEISIYVDHRFLKKGYGSTLLTALLQEMKNEGYYTAISVICTPNPPSEKLFLKFGFQKAGEYPKIGYKMGAWRDITEYLLPLREYQTPDRIFG